MKIEARPFQLFSVMRYGPHCLLHILLSPTVSTPAPSSPARSKTSFKSMAKFTTPSSAKFDLVNICNCWWVFESLYNDSGIKFMTLWDNCCYLCRSEACHPFSAFLKFLSQTHSLHSITGSLIMSMVKFTTENLCCMSHLIFQEIVKILVIVWNVGQKIKEGRHQNPS